MTIQDFNNRIKLLQLKKDLAIDPVSKQMWEDSIDLFKSLNRVEINWL